MTALNEISDRARHLSLDARSLCAEFIERIVSEAHTVDTDERGGEPPTIDWNSVWRAGDGAPSEEAAIGRIVRAASEAARGVVVHAPGFVAPSLPSNGLGGDGASGAPLTWPSVIGDEFGIQGVSAETEASSIASVPVQAQPLLATGQPAHPVLESEPAEVEPVTQPGEATRRGFAPMGLLTESPEIVRIEEAPTQKVHVVIPAAAQVVVGSDGPVDEVPRKTLDAPVGTAWFQVFTWTRNIGIVILLFVVWQLWGTSIAQHEAQSQLKTEFDAAVRSHHPPVAVKPGSLIPATTRFAPPADGSVEARLQIPAIGVEQYVVEGTNSGDLSRGPGHYVGTALPGQAGNVAIAGHRTTHGAPFNGLGHLVRGDRIILTTSWGERLTYIVTGTPVAVSPNDVAVLNYFGDNRITLTTCNPEFSSTQRLIAVGMLDDSVKTPPARAISYHVANSDTASWDWSLFPVVGIEVCLLLLLALSYRFFDVWFGSRLKLLILVPLWAAGLYLVFGTLTAFFPSSI